jgi:hypothetical protein
LKEYKYYQLVIGHPDHGVTSWGTAELDSLMNAGWHPIRETPMGGGLIPGTDLTGIAYLFASLILLEREKANP